MSPGVYGQGAGLGALTRQVAGGWQGVWLAGMAGGEMAGGVAREIARGSQV